MDMGLKSYDGEVTITDRMLDEGGGVRFHATDVAFADRAAAVALFRSPRSGRHVSVSLDGTTHDVRVSVVDGGLLSFTIRGGDTSVNILLRCSVDDLAYAVEEASLRWSQRPPAPQVES